MRGGGDRALRKVTQSDNQTAEFSKTHRWSASHSPIHHGRLSAASVLMESCCCGCRGRRGGGGREDCSPAPPQQQVTLRADMLRQTALIVAW